MVVTDRLVVVVTDSLSVVVKDRLMVAVTDRLCVVCHPDGARAFEKLDTVMAIWS